MQKYTYEEVKNFIEVQSDSGCILLSGDYLGANDTIRLKCKCGTEFNTTFSKFKRNTKPKRHCDECGLSIRIAKRTFSYEYVKEYIEVKSKSGCKLLSSEYSRSDSKLKIQCRCGKIYETTFTKFSSKSKPYNCCNGCAKENRDKERIDNIINFVDVSSNSGCQVLNTHHSKGRSLGLRLLCRCGNIFDTNYNRFKNQNDRTCRECNRLEEQQLYLKNFKEKVYDLEQDRYVVVGNFINAKTKVEILHTECNNTYFVVPSNFLNGNRCPYCNKARPKTDESFKAEVYSIVGNEYTVVSKYTTMKDKIDIIHNLCGNMFNMSASAFLNNGQRCPICSESKGEQSIRKYLSEKNINFEKEFSFDDLLSDKGNPLRYDFAILSNNNVVALIEYDGEFHFEKQYKNDGFEKLQIHDQRKNHYCKDNNIPLLRIPYWEFDNIEQILDVWLNKYELIHSENIEDIA